MRTSAAAIVFAVILVGCGSTSPKARYVAKLNAMCEDFAKREQRIGTPGSPADLKARGDRIVAAIEQAIVKPNERLKAPPEIAPQAAPLRTLARQQPHLLRALGAAGQAGEDQQAQRVSTPNQPVHRQ